MPIRKNVLLFLIILIPSVLFAELTDISSPTVIITVDIPETDNIHIFKFSFDLVANTGTPTITVKTVEDDPSAGTLTFTGSPIDTWEGVDENGFIISYSLSSAGDTETYEFTVEKKQIYDPLGAIDMAGPQLSLYFSGLSGTYTVSDPITGTCTDATAGQNEINPAPAADYYFCVPLADIAYIQIEDGAAESDDEIVSAHSTTDAAAGVELFANAYSSTDAFLGPLFAEWNFTPPFDAGDIDPSTPSFGSSILYKPDNAGTGTVSVSYKYDFESTAIVSASYPVTAAGPFAEMLIVDDTDNHNEILTLSFPADETRVLRAAEFDSVGVFRKYASANWSVTELPLEPEKLLNSTSGAEVTVAPECNPALPLAGDYTINAVHSSAANCDDPAYCDSTGTVTIQPLPTVSNRAIKLYNTTLDFYEEAPSSFSNGTSAVELFAAGYDSCGNFIDLQDVTWCITDQDFTGGEEGSFAGGVLSVTGSSVVYNPPANKAGSAFIKISSGACADPGELDSVEIKIDADISSPSGIRINISPDPQAQEAAALVLVEHLGSQPLHVALYDAYDNYIGPADADWSIDTETAFGHSLQSASVGSSNALDFSSSGVSYITAAATTGGFEYTGMITVMPDQDGLNYDVVHVLDHSGSMGNASYPGADAPSKMSAVKDATDYFINLMRDDDSNGYGLVIFDDITDCLEPPGCVPGNILGTLNSVLKQSLLENTVPGIVRRGWTSIGGGLTEGGRLLDTGLTDNKTLILLTDGKQNRPPYLNDFYNTYIDENYDFPIQIVALGYDWGVDSTVLKAFLEQLDGNPDGVYEKGSFNLIENSNDMQLKIFKTFNNIFLNASDSQMISDPVMIMQPGDPPFTESFTLGENQLSACFSVFWQGPPDAVDMRLRTSSGKIIDTDTVNNRIRIFEHPNYKMIELLFPVSNNLISSADTGAELIISVSDSVPENTEIMLTYSVSEILKEEQIDMAVSSGKSSIFAGDAVGLTAELLKENGERIKGGTISVECDVPLNSIANSLMETDLPVDDTVPPASSFSFPDETGVVERRIEQIERHLGTVIVERSKVNLALSDDGLHGDGEADDGLYGLIFEDTEVPGIYNFRFRAEDIDNGRGTTSREAVLSVHSAVKVDPQNSSIKLKIIETGPEGNKYQLLFTPRDRYGNYLGPGFPYAMNISSSAADESFLNKAVDYNPDGTYSASFQLSPSMLQQKSLALIAVDALRSDRENMRTEDITDLGSVLKVKKIPTHYQGQTGLSAAAVIPVSGLNTGFNTGFSASLPLGYSIRPELTVYGIFDYSYFPSNASGAALQLPDICLNIKYGIDLIRNDFQGSLSAGAGLYFPGFNSIRYGFNGGLNLEKRLSEHFFAAIDLRMHYLPDNGDIFLQAGGGIIGKLQLIY